MNTAVYHGGRLDQAIKQFGGLRSDWLDLSTGINPNAYQVPGLDPSIWQRLPEETAEAELIAAARDYYQVPGHAEIVIANGTQALIELLPTILPSQNIAIVSPTYGEHEHTWLKAGCHVEPISKGDALPILANGLVLVNPNNPDAVVHNIDELMALADEAAKKHGYLIVDEAFCDAVPQASIIPHFQDNIIVYRSFGKFFGLAGLRLGFLIAKPAIARQMQNLLGPWCISGPAIEIGKKALRDDTWVHATRASLDEPTTQHDALLQQERWICPRFNSLHICTTQL